MLKVVPTAAAVRCAILIVRVEGMPWPKTHNSHTQLGLSDKGRAMKGLVVCKSCDLESLDLLNGLALYYQFILILFNDLSLSINNHFIRKIKKYQVIIVLDIPFSENHNSILILFPF